MGLALGVEATINQHLAFIKPRTQELNTDYLYYLLGHAYAFFEAIVMVGSTKGAITCEQLENIKYLFRPVTNNLKSAPG